MRNMGKQQGSAAWAVPVRTVGDTVYVHSNIVQLETEDGSEVYEYDEVQYTASEYIEIQGNQIDELNNSLVETQLALVEVYELIS